MELVLNYPWDAHIIRPSDQNSEGSTIWTFKHLIFIGVANILYIYIVYTEYKWMDR